MKKPHITPKQDKDRQSRKYLSEYLSKHSKESVKLSTKLLKDRRPSGWKVAANILQYILMITAVVAIISLLDHQTAEAAEPTRICVASDRDPIVIDGIEYQHVIPECKERNVLVKIKRIFLYIGKIGLTIAAIFRGPAIVDSVTEMWEYEPNE